MKLTSLACATLALLCSGAVQSAVPVSRYRVVKVYPHDTQAYTQGLQYLGGFLYEGTGLNGRSEIRKVKLETGQVLQRRRLSAEYFGEGILVLGKELLQLTWTSQIGFVYDAVTFEPLRSFRYPGEGWGLAFDGTAIVMSDGTSSLRFWDPGTLKELRRLPIRDGHRAIDQLNELEFVNGEIWANIWQTNRVARINPRSGKVNGWIDLSGLLTPEEARTADVLNGIAYDAKGGRLFVTGKLWPKLFEIQLVPGR
jgi:glutamine cyclotransferase